MSYSFAEAVCRSFHNNSGQLTRGYAGQVHGQDFYLHQHVLGAPLALPFSRRHFTAFIDLPVPAPETVLRELALRLLRHGMRSAICWGYEAELLGEVIDRVIDDYGFWHGDQTAFCSVHEEEALEEALEFFILPCGLAETGLVLTCGDDAALRTLTSTFSLVHAGAREEVALAAR